MYNCAKSFQFSVVPRQLKKFDEKLYRILRYKKNNYNSLIKEAKLKIENLK